MVKQISPLKAPIPDVYACIFLSKVLAHQIGKNIFPMIIAFLRHEHFLKELKKTYITLIPEKEILKK